MIRTRIKICLSIIFLSLAIFLYNLSIKNPNELKYFFLSTMEKTEFNDLTKEQEASITRLEEERSRLEEEIVMESNKSDMDMEKIKRLTFDKENLEKQISNKGTVFTDRIRKRFGIELS